ncbi:MAG TPA: serine/threonine-protein kinase, partial [Sorangium sp.]|nr:serine/threonine-protein kinase [Sorangium sp.]
MFAGQQLTATLRLVRPLGQGAMGSVWVADHLALGIQVAVKFMAPAVAQEPGFAERFRREAVAAAQIKHPHVAQVLDYGVSSDGALYIAMELLDGETLKSRLQRLGPLPLAEVARIVAQTAKALGRAHQLGIVHRDIKPDNLFVLDLDGDPFIKILDFGVAKLDQSQAMSATATGSMLGTPLYMSPEQLLSAKHVDRQADLWALAVVAYRALTGALPFVGDTLGALSVAVYAGVFQPPSALRPDLPPAVDAWMARALQR